MPKLGKWLPEPLRLAIKKLLYFGRRHYCPVCDSRVRAFRAYGEPRRENALCPVCYATERHRMVWIYFQERTRLFDGTPKRMLHFAPEHFFVDRLRRVPGLDYVTADLYLPHVMVRTDITAIDLPDASFDVVYCSHVLEHVSDDRRAMREILRVLAPGGQAVLLVPITAERTSENLSVTDPAERRRLFGQEDHVRVYGPDFAERLADAGFAVEVLPVAEVVGAENLERLGSLPDECVYVGRRR